MRLLDILPPSDGQIFIAGKKGSGKSTLNLMLIDSIPDSEIILIIDSKDEWNLKPFLKMGNKPVHHLRIPNLMLVRKPGIYVYKSHYPHFYDVGVTRLLLQAFKHKHLTVVIHEMYHFCHGNNPLPALGQMITMGRNKFIRLHMESQRPSNIPVICYTEADVFVEFHLAKEADRKRMADVSEAPKLITVAEEHNFWVMRTEWNEPVYIRNNNTDTKKWDRFINKEKVA
jgi:energy-coupling factor transporter ATP-binding protein EcfA2